MKKILFCFILISAAFRMNLKAQENKRDSLFDSDWKFFQGKANGADEPDFDDRTWRTINLPHDWSIEDLPVSKEQLTAGPFDSKAIGGANTGFTTGGTGWYRKHFMVPEIWNSKVVTVLYDPIFAAFDVCGYSYQSSQYVTDHKRLPDRVMLSTEIDPRNCFSNWMRATDNKYVLGNFTWTAMDYMGEAASGWYSFADKPSSLFPWHTSYTGDLDLCGFRRPRSFYRDILFNTENKLSVFVYTPVPSFEGDGNSLWGWDDVKPSWTWPGYEGKSLKVFGNHPVEKSGRANYLTCLWQRPGI